MITYFWTGLFQSSPKWGATLIRSSRSVLAILTMWHAHIRADAFICNQQAKLWQDTIVVQMSFTIMIKDNHVLSYDWTRMVYIQPDRLSTSLCLSRYSTRLNFQLIALDNDRSSGDSITFVVLIILISSPEKKKSSSSQTSYKDSHKESGELQSGSFRWHHWSLKTSFVIQ